MMNELRFLMRDRSCAWIFGWALLLASVAVTLGVYEVHSQRNEIRELRILDEQEQEVILSEKTDWGSLAYYTFHMTYDAPSSFAFAAMGLRDSLPWKHRIRMLALEGQIYESDVVNPDFSLVGRFDYAFLLAVVSPLLVIFLLYDLRSGEKIAGRLELLISTKGSGLGLWFPRVVLRVFGLCLMVWLPLWVGGILSQTSLLILTKASALGGAYLVFWATLCFMIARPNASRGLNLTSLIALWIVLCGILPVLLSEVSAKATPMPSGSEILMTQREAVNDAWDLPKSETFEPFVWKHPELAPYTEVSKGFEWKWYYAFQQVGDQKAERLSRAYRHGRLKRDTLAGQWSFFSPASFVQRAFERWAATDTVAILGYEDQMRAFHQNLRMYYYERLFKGLVFDASDVDNRPQFWE